MDRGEELKKIAIDISERIKQFPHNTQFQLIDFFKEYEKELDMNNIDELFMLMKEIRNYCEKNNIEFVEVATEARLGMPWAYPYNKVNFLNDKNGNSNYENKEEKINKIATEIYNRIKVFPKNTVFAIGDFFEDYKNELNFENIVELFDLNSEVHRLCIENNIEIECLTPKEYSGMPWVFDFKKNN